MTRLYVKPRDQRRASIPPHRGLTATARDERRRGRAGGRLAVDRVARLLGQGRRGASPRRPRSTSGAARASSATARTSRPRRCGSAARARSRCSSPTSPTRSSAACCAAPSAPRAARATPWRSSTRPTTGAGRSRPSRRCGPGRSTATCSSRSTRRAASGPDEHVVLMEGEAPAAAVGALRRRGRRRGGLPPPRGARAQAHRAPRRRLRRADLPPARERAPARARRGRARSGHPAARAHADRIEDARQAAGPLLDERPTAVYCDDDLIAAGLYLAARERGLRLPRDLSVVGFDDMDFARALEPALTTVRLDAELLGATAFELLERRMAGRRTRQADRAPGGAARARVDGAARARRAG